MTKKHRILWLVFLVLLSFACAKSGGSTFGASSKCSSTGKRGSCNGSIKKLSGTISKTIENDSFFAGDKAYIEMDLSVETGSLTVHFESPSGVDQTATATPGAPIHLEVYTQADSFGIHLKLEALTEEVTDISYYIAYWPAK